MKIAAYEYTIKANKDLERTMGNRGTCCHGETTIEIDPSFPEQLKKETLMHEILEALTAINDWGEQKFDHHLLCQISEGVYAVIANNPDVFTYTLPEGI
jgi:hypothetical protein